MSHLQTLCDAVNEGGSRGLQIAILADIAGIECPGIFERAYLGNTQAAIDFVQSALPGWVIGNLGQATVDDDCFWTITPDWHCWIVAPDYLDSCRQAHSKGNSAARALLIATLKAMEAESQ